MGFALCRVIDHRQGMLKGEASPCTVDLLFDWFGLICFANKKMSVAIQPIPKPVKQEVNG
jgi:hypothetical protein